MFAQHHCVHFISDRDRDTDRDRDRYSRNITAFILFLTPWQIIAKFAHIKQSAAIDIDM